MPVDGLLDRLPVAVQHLIIVVAIAVFGWAGTDFVPWLESHPGWGATAGGALAYLITFLTPLVRQYGVGKRTGAGLAALKQ